MNKEISKTSTNWISKIKDKANYFKKLVGALYLAYKRPDVPLYAKITAIIVVGYALSPIDLIPDFIPILGYLDDLILIPLGVALAIRLIPKEIMSECIQQSEGIFTSGKPKSWVTGIIILSIWVLIITYIIFKII